MATKTICGKTVQVNEEGFMTNPAEWDKEIAVELAKEEGIAELTEAHWKVIDFCRSEGATSGKAPTLRQITTGTGLTHQRAVQPVPQRPRQESGAHLRPGQTRRLCLILIHCSEVRESNMAEEESQSRIYLLQGQPGYGLPGPDDGLGRAGQRHRRHHLLHLLGHGYDQQSTGSITWRSRPVGNSSMKMNMMGVPGYIGIPQIMGVLPGMTPFATSLMNKKMKELGVPPVREYLEMLVDAGAKLYACKMSVDMMDLKKEDFIAGV